jgi:hypothetical protein
LLIEAQARKLLAEQQKPKTDAEEKKDDETTMEVDEADEVKKESTDVEMKDSEEKPPEESPKKEEDDEKPIDIDPKTFCKLGHFHLLLEDFAKGECLTLFLLDLLNPLSTIQLQHYRLIRNIEVSTRITGKTRRSCTDWESFIITSIHYAGE